MMAAAFRRVPPRRPPVRAPASITVHRVRLDFAILGPLTVQAGRHEVTVTGERQRLVLAALLLRANRTVPVEHLAAVIWDEDPPDTARRQVQNAVSQVRQQLRPYGGSGLVRRQPGGYQLELGPHQLDLPQFEFLAGQGRELIAAKRPAEAVAALRQALSLWRGPALAGLGGDTLRRQAARLDELRMVTLEACTDQDLALGGHEELVAQLAKLVDEHPLRERLAGALMLALYRTGSHVEALAVYRRLASDLRDELGVDPTPKLQALFQAILRRDPALEPPGISAEPPATEVPALPAAPTLPAAPAAAASTGDVASARPSTRSARSASAPNPVAVRPARAPLSRSRSWRVLAPVSLILMIMLSLTGAGARPDPPMTGLFNVVVVPFGVRGQASHADLVADRLQSNLFAQLKEWASQFSWVQLRGPKHTADGPPGPAAQVESLAGTARRYGADLVLTGSLVSDGGRLSLALELFVTDRTLGETPEFSGLHQLTISEPVDVLSRNWQLNESLADAALHYLKGVVAFTRGLGEYALDDFAGAERAFHAAETEFTSADRVPGSRAGRREALYLMLGNAVGKADSGRMSEASAYYARALAENPGYSRAQLGLAEAARVAAGCRPGKTKPDGLRRALDSYHAALAADRGGDRSDHTLLEMKARLGLGLTSLCLARSGHGDQWGLAGAQFDAVIRLRETTAEPADRVRHALRLAAEAKAGIGLIAMLTAPQPGAAALFGGYPAAARAYEDALDMLDSIGVVRRTTVERQRIFLCNLRPIYQSLSDTERLQKVDERLSTAERRLAEMKRSASAAPGTTANTDGQSPCDRV